MPVVPKGYVMNEEAAREIFACNDRYDLKKLLAKWKQQSLNARMKPDPAFATSPICVTDKDYEFSVDPDIITLVESDPFYGYESETVVAHLTKLNDIAALFTNNERSRYLYLLKIFPFSLMGDAKIGDFVVKTLTYTFMYYYIMNSLKNLVIAYPSNKLFRVLYYFFRFEFTKLLPKYMNNILNKAGEEIDKESEDKKQKGNEE